jgi:NAD+ synthase (glutamine-hydrolysing)
MSEVRLTGDLGFLRVGTAVPELRIADIDFNVDAITQLIKSAADQGVQVLSFPEMSLTGYSLGDLVQQEILLSKALKSLRRLLDETAQFNLVCAVGMPVSIGQQIFNCAVLFNAGHILGVIPKTYLPTYREYYEYRWFSPAEDAPADTIELAGQQVPFGTDILFQLPGTRPVLIGVEICEDLWVPLSPHEFQAAAGATLLLNLSASNEILGKAEWRRTIIAAESGRCIAAYCYASAGMHESSNDVVYGGQALIAENGLILLESKRLSPDAQLITADIDIERLEHDRQVDTSFHRLPRPEKSFRIVETRVNDPLPGQLQRTLEAHPFVPSDPTQRSSRCRDIFAMQIAALAQKLSGAGKNRVVIGVSGGLDSTLTLLVAAKTMDFMHLSPKNIYAFTLPGFGTTRRTRTNATKLCEALGVNFGRANITRSCTSQLKDLEHAGQQDVVFENVQARYRYAFLFNKANALDAIMLGTGDLTEIALGWSTFAGDHISHYDVNASVPKTLVRYLVRWVADEELAGSPAREILYSILDTPISPELLRPENGKIVQKSEDVIGPVELADFYLYPFIRFGARPGKILYLAEEVRKQGLFDAPYTLPELHRWLRSFITRFFNNQFKRTCLPEGPKIGSVSLSPRGDWRMPSDAKATLWLQDLEEMYKKLKEK